MSNFVSNSDANALMSEIGKKKLTVTDVMPLAASAANEGIPYLYLGATTQNFTNGSIYECQEVTPATDPKTYEWVEKYQSSVDLTYYKRIWGGTEAGWELLTDEQKAQYEYTFFEGDSDYTLSIANAVTKGDMHPVTSNAVAEEVEDIDAEISDIVNVYSAKNLIPYPYVHASGRVNRGITFTYGDDGIIYGNGTHAESGQPFIQLTQAETIETNKWYIVSLDSNVDNACLSLYFGSDPTWEGVYDDGTVNSSEIMTEKNLIPTSFNGVYHRWLKFKITANNSGFSLHARFGAAQPYTLTNAYIKPLLRLASIKDDTYAPYAKTNYELTKNISGINDASLKVAATKIYPTLTTGTNYNNRTWYYKKGNQVRVNIGVSDLDIDNTTKTLFTLPEGYRPIDDVCFVVLGFVAGNYGAIRIYANGVVTSALNADKGVFGYVEFDAVN